MTLLLESDRLRLRRLVAGDIDHLVALDGDPEVMRFLSGGVPTPRKVIEARVLPRMLIVDARFRVGGFWAVTSRVGGEFLGWVGLEVRPESEPIDALLGYRLRRDSWGRGYATEAARVLIDGLFRVTCVKRVVATAYQENRASVRVMEKLGMHLVRRYRMTRAELESTATYRVGDGDPWDGDDVEYAVDRSSWLQLERREHTQRLGTGTET